MKKELLKYILEKGKIEAIIPETGGGISGEAHLVKYKNKRYILRKTSTIEKAKRYREISKKLNKYRILPRYLGQYSNKVLYEYIEGRDLKTNEKPEVFEQIGEIVAIVSRLKTKSNKNGFKKQLNELVTGIFSKNFKVDIKRYRERIDKRRIKPLISKERSEKIMRIYEHLYKISKPKFVYDANDVTPNNFRLRKGKVYFVDIEGIKPKINGFGIAKCFLKWAKEDNEKMAFKKGYEKFEKWFFVNEYADLCYLMFIIQAINYKCQIGRDYKADLKRLNNMIKKYNLI
jgi:hypothetical protein